MRSGVAEVKLVYQSNRGLSENEQEFMQVMSID